MRLILIVFLLINTFNVTAQNVIADSILTKQIYTESVGKHFIKDTTGIKTLIKVQ